MTHSISLYSQIDPEDEWRRALVKVYALLLKLSEAENGSPIPVVANELEKVEEPASSEELVPA